MAQINLPPIVPDMDFYTVEQLAVKMQVSVRTIRDAIASGELKTVQPGKRHYISHSAFTEYLNNSAK